MQQWHLLALACHRRQHHRPGQQRRHCSPRASSLGLGLTSNFRLPQTCTRTAPKLRSRRASASVCASTAASVPATGRTSAPMRSPLAWLFVEPGVGQHDRHALVSGAAQQVRPDLGFHQHAHRRSMVAQEAAHRTGRVRRQPALHVAFAQQGLAGFAACRGAVRQQQAQARPLRTQRIDQRRRRTGFPQRHRMQPQRTRRCGAVAEAQPLGQRMPVQRLAPAAPPQAQQIDRGQKAQQRRVADVRQPGLQCAAVSIVASGLTARSAAMNCA